MSKTKRSVGRPPVGDARIEARFDPEFKTFLDSLPGQNAAIVRDAVMAHYRREFKAWKAGAPAGECTMGTMPWRNGGDQ